MTSMLNVVVALVSGNFVMYIVGMLMNGGFIVKSTPLMIVAGIVSTLFIFAVLTLSPLMNRNVNFIDEF